MYSFSYLEPVCCSMSSSVASWNLHTDFSGGRSVGLVFPSLSEFSSFFVIHTDKGFGIVNKAKVDDFWNSLAFLMIQRMLAIWSLVPLPFLNPDWTSGYSQFTYCWSLAWRILSIILLVCAARVRGLEVREPDHAILPNLLFPCKLDLNCLEIHVKYLGCIFLSRLLMKVSSIIGKTKYESYINDKKDKDYGKGGN